MTTARLHGWREGLAKSLRDLDAVKQVAGQARQADSGVKRADVRMWRKCDRAPRPRQGSSMTGERSQGKAPS